MEEYVWVAPKEGNSEVPIGAQILAKFGPRIKIKDDDHKEYWVSPEEILRPMHPTSITGVEDMISLGELQEYSILRNLQIRYNKDLIYTYIGSILVAVNPYKPLPIYDGDKMNEYRKKRLGDLPPHIFAVADHSYENMRKKSEKRCLVISGESGAGKTESTKLFLRYFAAISHRLTGKEQQILDSNPILEAFGNAKTVCNDNSSRFGKYINIMFNTDGSIQSAQIKQYLLEKSRIVSQNQGEQNYHIFYSLLAGLKPEEKRQLRLKTTSSYNYLTRGSAKNEANNSEMNEIYNLDVIKSAMKVLNFSDSEIWSIFELTAAILHFGNIEFETVLVYNGGKNQARLDAAASNFRIAVEEQLLISSRDSSSSLFNALIKPQSNCANTEAVNSYTTEEIENICFLLRVSEKPLMDSLTRKTISTHGDNVIKYLSKQEAINSRDAFVKKIFGNLFNFIVEKINAGLSANEKTSNCHIGILDIFGFEAFSRNSFEQLCINYANERLQQFFIGHVFKAEQELYATENISWKFVDYPDNSEILNLIENGPRSVLSVINDSTKIPRGSDQSMLDKLIELHSENPFFFKSKSETTPVFGIQHYAGVVLYDKKDFVEKNHDSCSLDIKQVVRSSKNNFLKEIFSSDFEEDSSAYYKKRMETLASKFKSSLDLLMNELNECQPFFVRCIRPNQMKKPQKFDRMLCLKQLTYSGMTEVTKVREAGYPVRYDFVQFVQHYRMLVPGIPLAHKTPCKEATQRICQTVFRHFPNPDYRIGRTKIFLKNSEDLFLEAQRERILYAYAVIIQKIIRGWLARRKYEKLKKAVAMTEKLWIEKQQRLQEFQQRRQLIVRFQALCKGYLIRTLFKRKLEQAHLHELEAPDSPDEKADFKIFARRYFQENQNYRFSKKPIKTSLTRLVQPEERIAAKAIWLTILRYTANGSRSNISTTSGGAQLREILKVISTVNKDTASKPQKDIERAEHTEKINRLYENWLKTQKSHLQKLCFIIGHGIKRPELRDEIYCQICKVLTKNPSKKGTHNGWVLLTACTGCFPPSDLFLQYLKTFIRKGDPKYTSFSLFRLHRTNQNGPRSQPPFTTELEAIKRQKPVNVEVFLMNGTSTSVKIDSATTANELLGLVAKNIKLADVFGYSLMLGQEMKSVTLGDGSTFVLDAVSEYEQYVTEVGGCLESMPWKLYLRREMFPPWHDFIRDELSINLTYHQIKKGIISGEYSTRDLDLPSLVAQICFADKGKLQSPALDEAIPQYIPQYIYNYLADDLDNFKQQVKIMYLRMFEDDERSMNFVRGEIVKYAAVNWTKQFSRSFTVVGSIRNSKSAEAYPEVPLKVGVNSSGIYFIDETNEKRAVAKLDFVEIREVSRKEVAEDQGYILKISNYEGMEISLTFRSVYDIDFHRLLINISETMKNYSKFAMAVKNYKTTDESFLELRVGDLITLTDKFYGKDLLRNTWAQGINSTSGKSGNFLLECVEIIPAMRKPSEVVVNSMRDAVQHGKRFPFCQNTQRLKHYTLESYAEKFFRAPEFKLDEQGNSKPSELWKYSKEGISKPLHAKLVNKENEAKQAVGVFEAILRYVDNKDEADVEQELVSRIFAPGLENGDLRNEVYCQIMKQLTSNPNKTSENKTWELMWMITGLYPCGELLAAHVKKFLQSRRSIQIARDCFARFNQVSVSDHRKHTPHFIEIEAVKNRPCHIYHRVYFPDDTHKFFQVSSLTTVKELKEAIFTRLGMNASQRGFSLLLQVSGRLFSLPEDFYVFDFLQILQKWVRRNKMPVTKAEYKICFMKHIWKNSIPGHDDIINQKFLFPQEYNKYIQGYYEIPEQNIIQLAALLYKVFPSTETTQQFQKIAEKIIPSKVFNLMKSDFWEKEIKSSSSKHLQMTAEDCKVQFLKQISEFTSRRLLYFATMEHSQNLTNYIFYPVTMNLSFK